jgi:hypothetical protein
MRDENKTKKKWKKKKIILFSFNFIFYPTNEKPREKILKTTGQTVA